MADDGAFRVLFESHPAPMWVYDVTTFDVLEVNAAAVAYQGSSREAILRMRLTDLRPAEELARLGTASPVLDFAGRRAAVLVAGDLADLRETQALLKKSSERLQLLHEIDRALIAAEAPAAIAEAALQRLRDLLDVPRVIVNLFDLEAGEAEWLAAIGRRRLHAGPGVRFPLSLMGDVAALARGELQVIETAALPRSAAADALLASGIDTYMVVPMIAQGELIGAVSFGGAPSTFSPEQVDIAREVAAQMAITLAQVRLTERVKRQAEDLERRVVERTEELHAAREEAERANRAKSDFLSRMSHELRTPLNAILGFGQLLERRVDDPRDRESVALILSGGRHLLNLINEILDIARIESGQLPLSPEPVQIGEALKRVLDLAQPLATARRIAFDAGDVTGDERYVQADAQRLQQVLLNLVSNAIKYDRDGGRITLACVDVGADWLRISVSDTGPGIPLALQSRLFTPFDRLGAETAPIEGTGLGLALSKCLVEAMGGRIGVESEAGRGSTFWVELARTTSPDQRSGLGRPGATDDPEAGARPGTILYVEDNASNLRLVERVISEHTTMRLISAQQGRLGLTLAREHRPDVILLDLHLPDMPGEEVLREVLGDPALRATPVIILSADATPGQVKRLLAAGARVYLTKPLDVVRLLEEIDGALAAGGRP